MQKPNVTVIANAATDLLYSGQAIQDIAAKDNGKTSIHTFLDALPNLLGHGENGRPVLPEAPRIGDAILVPDQILDNVVSKSLQGQEQFLSDSFNNPDAHPITHLAGTPQKAPGGALANTSATIAHSDLGHMKFLSVSDEREEERTIFAKSFPEDVVIPKPIHGKTLGVHVFPIHGDRIQIASPSLNNAADKYDLSPHIPDVIDVDTDILMIEGFMAFGPHYQKIVDATLASIEAANKERDALGRAPIHLVITAASQPISDMESHRNFVKRAIETTDVTVHANTGEFRRIVDQDQEWRKPFQPDFMDEDGKELIGSKLEEAKKKHTTYQNAKTQANMDVAINTAVMAANAPYNVRFIVTDGGNKSHVIQNDKHWTYVPDKINTDNIVNKVGAGDAFMAGFWIAQLKGLDIENSMKIGGVFARDCLYQDAARLSKDQIDDLITTHVTPLVSQNDEIERKFLVENDDWKSLPNIGETAELTQGYIPQDQKNNTRLYVTIPDDKSSIAHITVESDNARYGFEGLAEIDDGKFGEIVKIDAYNPVSHEVTLKGRVEARVRIKESDTDVKGVFAVKQYEETGRANRKEFQIEITPRAADYVLTLFGENIVKKQRTEVPYKGKTWEIDEYLDENAGLITADIEVRNKDELDTLLKVPGAGADITDEESLRNQNIAAHGVPQEYRRDYDPA